MAAKKKTGRSADASAGAAEARKLRGTGQSRTSSMDAVTRRYKIVNGGSRQDRVSGIKTGPYGDKYTKDPKTAQQVGGLTAALSKRDMETLFNTEATNILIWGTAKNEAKRYEQSMAHTRKKSNSVNKMKNKKGKK